MTETNPDQWVHSTFGVNPAASGAPGGGGPGGGAPGGGGPGNGTVPNLLDPNLIQNTFGYPMFQTGEYLRQHHLQRSGDQVVLDGQAMSADQAARQVIQALHFSFSPALVAGWVRDEARQAADIKPAAAAGAGPQYSLSYAVVPVTGHVDTGTGQTSRDGVQQQLAFTVTFALHPDGHAGPELAWTTQVAASTDGGFAVQNVLSGVQGAWVIPFLNGALQVSALASALVGVSRGQPSASGSVAMQATTQIGVGGQVTYAIPGTSNHVLIGFQLAGSVTAAHGSNPTLDASPQGFLQIQWN